MVKIFYELFLKILLIIFIVYILISVTLFFLQRNLLYHPSENNYFEDNLTVPIDKVKITTKDNIELLGKKKKKDTKDYKTILFLHGNAGSLENRIHKINHFEDMNVNFLIIAWRGFSGNKGNPSEKGLYDDANSAVLWLEKKGIMKKKLPYNFILSVGDMPTDLTETQHWLNISTFSRS